jgi:hypothetical protein
MNRVFLLHSPWLAHSAHLAEVSWHCLSATAGSVAKDVPAE